MATTFPRTQPANVTMMPASGTGNMGDVTDPKSVGRFWLGDAGGLRIPFRLVFIRGLFTGGSSSAPLAVMVDNCLGTQFDFTLETLLAVGTGTGSTSKLHMIVSADERDVMVFKAGDEMVLEWTNPGSLIWGVEVGLAPA